MNLTYLVAWLSVLVAAAPGQTWAAIGQNLLYGFVIPYTVWNYLMGFTVYAQHTHPRAPWFRTEEAAREAAGQEDVTVHLKFPKWYGLISHHIMDHPAHHVNPKIPLYRLKKAQDTLNDALGARAVVDKFTPAYLFRLSARCKLYDYCATAGSTSRATPSMWRCRAQSAPPARRSFGSRLSRRPRARGLFSAVA